MSPPHVLVIDGSHAARYRLRIALVRQGAAVRTVASAEEALAMLEDPHAQPRPDVVFANRVLPGMNALELLELLRLDPRRPGPPVVITGADGRWPLRGIALARGAAAVLPPDADAEVLNAVLTRLGTPVGKPPATARPASRRSRLAASRHLPLGLLIAGAGAALLAALLTHP